MPAPEVIFLSGDLIFAGRVRAVCEAAELRFTFGTSLPQPGEDHPAEDVRWVILDLSTRGGIVNTLVPEARERFAGARVIAYAPHVHKSRLEAAREAGFDAVMTRGQFDSWLPQIGSV
ncbi:histidine kinase [Candidatus Laterigemmans baculatus]|uniref:histidine kinase n=1 Tax=Candidatus Laterigemmans baculatus TaxID=2770505 RepID=UPI0013DD69E7|nr:histidine kinase [Candidatus Laterigemmans baculatus]